MPPNTPKKRNLEPGSPEKVFIGQMPVTPEKKSPMKSLEFTPEDNKYAKHEDLGKTKLVKKFTINHRLYGLNYSGKIDADTLRREFIGIIKRTKPEFGQYFVIDNLNNSQEIQSYVQVLSEGSDTKSLGEISDPVLATYRRYLQGFVFKRPGGDQTFEDRCRGKSEIYIIKQACKAALLQDGITISFCLDGVDDYRAASKIANGKVDTSITTAELRFVYKNWDSLSQKVKFYRRGKELLTNEENPRPPWLNERGENIWEDKFNKTSTAKEIIEKLRLSGKKVKGSKRRGPYGRPVRRDIDSGILGVLNAPVIDDSYNGSGFFSHKDPERIKKRMFFGPIDENNENEPPLEEFIPKQDKVFI